MARITSWILVGLASASIGAGSLPIEIKAQAGCLIDMDSGIVMWSKRDADQRPIASLTKVATALTILEAYEPDLQAVIEAAPEALAIKPQAERFGDIPYGLQPDGTSIDLRPGERMSVEALLEGLLIRSGNDAANVLAYFFGNGSISAFTEKMNNYLSSIGCTGTYLKNPHGLDVPDHRSTAADLAIITRRAMQHPLIRSIVRKQTFDRPITNVQSTRQEPTTNRFLRPGSLYDSRVIGVKTGSTSKAGSCLITAADLNGREVVAVILGANGSQRYIETRHLLDVAAAEKKTRKVLIPAGLIGEPRTVHGAEDGLQPYVKQDLAHWIFPSAEIQPKVELRLHANLRPPIAQDEEIGVLVALHPDGGKISETPLLAASSVAPTWSYRISQLWKHWGKWGDGAVLLSLLIGLGVWLWALSTHHEKRPS